MLVLIQLTAMYITKSVSGLMTKCYLYGRFSDMQSYFFNFLKNLAD